MTVKFRLWAVMLLSTIFLLVVGGTGYWVARGMGEIMDTIINLGMPSIKLLNDSDHELATIRLALLQHILESEGEDMAQLEKKADESFSSITGNLKEYEKYLDPASDKDRELLARDRKLTADFYGLAMEVFTLSRNDKETAKALYASNGASVSKEANSAIAEHLQFNYQTSAQYGNEALAFASRGISGAGVLTLLGSAVLLLLAWPLTSKINRALAELRKATERITTQLDFTTRIKVDTRDELGALAHSINDLIEKTQNNLQSIARSAASVVAAADVLAGQSRQVAQASERQTESASSMAASIEEMAVSISHVGDQVGSADQISRDSDAIAQEGRAVICDTVQDIEDIAATVRGAATMIDQLERQSAEISMVVGVIKEVADQTNLLALNAAIEAARAGEQGRGFAVVADEVRLLAERTAASTQKITDTINAMRQNAQKTAASMQQAVLQVERGVARASNASTSIERIGQSSSVITAMVGEINLALREQNQASSEIAVQIEQIARMSEENNAAASATSHSALNLETLANQMQQIVASYRLA